MYIFTHKFKLSDEKKSKQKEMLQRAFKLVQESAGNFAEDGLGADWLNLDSLGRPGAPVIVLEYSGLRACVLEEAVSVSWQ